MWCRGASGGDGKDAISRKPSVTLVGDGRSMHAQIEGSIAVVGNARPVGTATSGEAGIRLVARTRLDLVLLETWPESELPRAIAGGPEEPA